MSFIKKMTMMGLFLIHASGMQSSYDGYENASYDSLSIISDVVAVTISTRVAAGCLGYCAYSSVQYCSLAFTSWMQSSSIATIMKMKVDLDQMSHLMTIDYADIQTEADLESLLAVGSLWFGYHDHTMHSLNSSIDLFLYYQKMIDSIKKSYWSSDLYKTYNLAQDESKIHAILAGLDRSENFFNYHANYIKGCEFINNYNFLNNIHGDEEELFLQIYRIVGRQQFSLVMYKDIAYNHLITIDSILSSYQASSVYFTMTQNLRVTRNLLFDSIKQLCNSNRYQAELLEKQNYDRHQKELDIQRRIAQAEAQKAEAAQQEAYASQERNRIERERNQIESERNRIERDRKNN